MKYKTNCLYIRVDEKMIGSLDPEDLFNRLKELHDDIKKLGGFETKLVLGNDLMCISDSRKSLETLANTLVKLYNAKSKFPITAVVGPCTIGSMGFLNGHLREKAYDAQPGAYVLS